MVLGIKNKNRRGPSIQVEYLIHVQDIKPWPPSQSLKTVRSVLIQWENGERSSGSTSAAAPSLNDGKIEFNESFRLSVTLSRDMSVKNGDADVFHKNLLEFNLYEPRRDKTVKGQLLGTAIIDLAEYGFVKEVTSIGTLLNCTRSFRNTAQPILHLRIQTYDKARSSSSLRGRLAKEGSMDKNDGDSVSALMSEEYADEAEVASLTDDDISSHSSVTASSAHESSGASPSLNKENCSGREKSQNTKEYLTNSSHGSPNNMPSFLSGTSESVSESKSENMDALKVESSTSCQQIMEELHSKHLLEEDPPIFTSEVIQVDAPEKPNSGNDFEHGTQENGKKIEVLQRKICMMDVAARADSDEVEIKDVDEPEKSGQAQKIKDDRGDASSNTFSLDSVRDQVLSGSDSLMNRDRFRHVKSVRSPMASSRSNGSAGGFSGSTVKQDSKLYAADKTCVSSNNKTQELERRIKMLETELREAAAMEVALYSVVAEHGSSVNKVHAPARRLSRLYLQADSGMKRASAAQSAVSGLLVVAKACGNDVPRLSFWLSNCVVLRAIVSEGYVEEQLPVSASPFIESNGVSKGVNTKLSTKKCTISPEEQNNRSSVKKSFQDWENPHSFMSALEKVESWIFSRIVESVWWQTLTPHMQSSAAKLMDIVVDFDCKRNYRRTSSSSCQEQVNFSLELWKRAFRDACERLCPVRSGGHECGCLPVLAKLIMEQCVARLDVAMFNAILRESSDDIPTDPVSDPISDARVLPIPAGKSSFGAGAQLKNAIGNWSRWLTDLFGMDDDDGRDDDYNERNKYDSSKSFHLLKSLSDLMMLPKDMLLSESVRREVCPTMGAQLIKRILESFVPDEFCPDPVPDALFETLDCEEIYGEGEGSTMNFPCTAPAVIYCPPSASSLTGIMDGSLGKGSQSQLRRSASVLRRSNTSDDELDELDSPLNSILGGSLQASPAQMRPNWKVVQNHQQIVLRYQLLREVWDNDVEM